MGRIRVQRLPGGQRASSATGHTARTATATDRCEFSFSASPRQVRVDGHVVGAIDRSIRVCSHWSGHSHRQSGYRPPNGRKAMAAEDFGSGRSAADTGAPVLVVSRSLSMPTPSRVAALPGTRRRGIDGRTAGGCVRRCASDAGAEVAIGVFGAHMSVELVSDGPVTVMLEPGFVIVPRSAGNCGHETVSLYALHNFVTYEEFGRLFFGWPSPRSVLPPRLPRSPAVISPWGRWLQGPAGAGQGHRASEDPATDCAAISVTPSRSRCGSRC